MTNLTTSKTGFHFPSTFPFLGLTTTTWFISLSQAILVPLAVLSHSQQKLFRIFPLLFANIYLPVFQKFTFGFPSPSSSLSPSRLMQLLPLCLPPSPPSPSLSLGLSKVFAWHFAVTLKWQHRRQQQQRLQQRANPFQLWLRRRRRRVNKYHAPTLSTLAQIRQITAGRPRGRWILFEYAELEL